MRESPGDGTAEGTGERRGHASGGATVLAAGTELKNAFTLLDGSRAYVSQHIGDMENQATLDFYEEMLKRFLRWFHLTPRVVAHDLHPDYLATRFARRYAADHEVPLIGVQHHHAHIASVMAENGIAAPVIGLALDGTGYGTDGAIWGCEFMVADRGDFERAGHLAYVPLPGGDAAVRHPYRVALSHLHAAGEADPADWGARLFPLVDAGEITLVAQQIEKRVNCIDTSSAGRLFDAVSALLGVCTRATYEAQAAIELEMQISRLADWQVGKQTYPFELEENDGLWIIRLRETFAALLDDLEAGVPVPQMSARFHATAARIIIETCKRIAEETGLRVAALSGGVFQNRVLLAATVSGLRESGFNVLIHRQVPANDGGLSLGQAMIANFVKREA